jgi:hypothetical protein
VSLETMLLLELLNEGVDASASKHERRFNGRLRSSATPSPTTGDTPVTWRTTMG